MREIQSPASGHEPQQDADGGYGQRDLPNGDRVDVVRQLDLQLGQFRCQGPP